MSDRLCCQIKWNGKYALTLDENGAHWGPNEVVGPCTLHKQPASCLRLSGAFVLRDCLRKPDSLSERRLCLTIYNPAASSEWSGRNGGEQDKRGLTESLDVRLVGGESESERGSGSGGGSGELRLSGEFQREYEGALPCDGKRRAA